MIIAAGVTEHVQLNLPLQAAPTTFAHKDIAAPADEIQCRVHKARFCLSYAGIYQLVHERVSRPETCSPGEAGRGEQKRAGTGIKWERKYEFSES